MWLSAVIWWALRNNTECLTSFSPITRWAFCAWQKSDCWAWCYESFISTAISCLLFLHEITAEIIVLDMWCGVIPQISTKWWHEWLFMTSYTWMLFPKCLQDGSRKKFYDDIHLGVIIKMSTRWQQIAIFYNLYSDFIPKIHLKWQQRKNL